MTSASGCLDFRRTLGRSIGRRELLRGGTLSCLLPAVDHVLAGRAHGHERQARIKSCLVLFQAGGGVRGGQYHGASDKEGWYPRENPVHVGDLAATIYDAFGIDARATLTDAGGRPHRLADGQPIRGIW